MGPDGQALRSIPRRSQKELEVCARCHARRQQFSTDPGVLGNLFDAFQPSALEPGLYYSDGQQREEVFNYGSFVQSRMYAAGVTCSDCHNPHSGKLHKPGNAVCAQCHAPERFDTAGHHHHRTDSAGSQCAACHMPTTTYMVVDARHDHSMRIPRPDRTTLLGSPNGCNQCHGDKPASWASAAIKAWYPSPKPGAQTFAEAFDLGERGAPGARDALLRIAKDGEASDIARASAFTRLASYPSREVLEAAVGSLTIGDPMVGTAAMAIIAQAEPDTRRAVLPPLLRDGSRLVRMQAARALAGQLEAELRGDDRVAFDKALAEYVAGRLFNAERPEAHVNLASLYREQGKVQAARASLRTAIELDAKFIAAPIALAEIERTPGDEQAAENILREALLANPRSGPLAHALGLCFIRQKRLAVAMNYLTQAAQWAPEEARFGYVLAVALHDRGKTGEAISTLNNVLSLHPYDRDVLLALVSYEAEMGNLGTALERAELLETLEPRDQRVAHLVALLRQKVR